MAYGDSKTYEEPGKRRTTYGDLPKDLGLVDLSPTEMMFWLYCPISTPREATELPPNLVQFRPIVDAVIAQGVDHYCDSYVYITAKTLWVEGGYIGNRPGWHSDGFGTDDVNYIWYDRAPTEFFQDRFDLPDDCADAMARMEARAASAKIVTYPAKHLLRLTPSVIHRSPVGFAPGMRTFVKVSVSADQYNLEGNSINHGLAERWPLVPRAEVRNHPHASVRNQDFYRA
jgi:hypothetical protein